MGYKSQALHTVIAQQVDELYLGLNNIGAVVVAEIRGGRSEEPGQRGDVVDGRVVAQTLTQLPDVRAADPGAAALGDAVRYLPVGVGTTIRAAHSAEELIQLLGERAISGERAFCMKGHGYV